MVCLDALAIFGDQMLLGETVQWSDVSVPFSRCAVRVRLFSSGFRGKDQLLGKATINLTEVRALEGQKGRKEENRGGGVGGRRRFVVGPMRSLASAVYLAREKKN
jgi:hypothetical protein